MTFDFTLGKYAQLCESIKALDCPVVPVREYLAVGKPRKKMVILRHDVDRDIGAAMRMANMESEFGLRSTYYVRKQASVFKPDALKAIYGMGHEVGYHYEVLSKVKGDIQKAIQLFERELKSFRQHVPIETISMHGRPLSPWNNTDVWNSHEFEDFGIKGDAVLSLSGKSVYYFTDTGRSWGATRFNLRDYVESLLPPHPIVSTDDLIDFVKGESTYPICISAHPNRWAEGIISIGFGVMSDWAINQVKWGIQMLRGNYN